MEIKIKMESDGEDEGEGEDESDVEQEGEVEDRAGCGHHRSRLYWDGHQEQAGPPENGCCDHASFPESFLRSPSEHLNQPLQGH